MRRTHELDWAATLREQSDAANIFARRLSAVVGAPDFTVQQAQSLYRTAEQLASAVDRMASEMKLADVDCDLLAVSEALQDLWAELCLTSFGAMREAQRRTTVVPS
ncbi:hypothetical protein PYH37_001239 [Sinorhizobium numidicum]|uniref:Uncharacterized protein n=1 Tax=Sinorhizobium numidicum TaxID=680248 RepID=A0ABY8CRD2_9HYPH|nr:hypothetical protein [Sinorhizobium numidicum]WEX73885.1 hypothetical protein PYH37_001239 [Sinorhizobium numidicum]WEX79870.1 hypothetical protein PYH38_001240 [Sinorhizobium numidicum]